METSSSYLSFRLFFVGFLINSLFILINQFNHFSHSLLTLRRMGFSFCSVVYILKIFCAWTYTECKIGEFYLLTELLNHTATAFHRDDSHYCYVKPVACDCESGAGGAWMSGCSPRWWLRRTVPFLGGKLLWHGEQGGIRSLRVATEASGSVAERSDASLWVFPGPTLSLTLRQAHLGKLISSQDGADCCWFHWEAKIGEMLF